MSVVTFLRDIVVPILTASTLVGCLYLFGLFVSLGSIGGAVVMTLISAAFGLFVYNDAKRLLAKIT